MLSVTEGPSGSLRVCENAEFRWMEFQDGAVQSAMALDDPVRLVLRYSVAVLTALPLVRLPRRVLLLGLGSGALARFARANGARRVVAVDSDPGVIEAARRWFGCTGEVASVHHADARDHLARDLEHYDLVCCDLFHARGMAQAVDSAAFVDAMAARLTDRGLLVMNVAAEDRDELAERVQVARGAVSGGAVGLFVPDTGNAIVSAFASSPAPRARSRLERRARFLARRSGVPFPRLLNALYAAAGVRGGRLELDGAVRGLQRRP